MLCASIETVQQQWYVGVSLRTGRRGGGLQLYLVQLEFSFFFVLAGGGGSFVIRHSSYYVLANQMPWMEDSKL